MISIEEAAQVFRKHAAEILREIKAAPDGFPVMAEVGSEGEWYEAGCVYPGQTSWHPYKIFFAANEECELEDVLIGIDNWLFALLDRARKKEEEEEDYQTAP